jgi:hypothetical protein
MSFCIAALSHAKRARKFKEEVVVEKNLKRVRAGQGH